MIGEPQTLKLSERVTVEVAELDGFESDRADLIVAKIISGNSMGANGATNAPFVPITEMMLLSGKVYALCSVRKLNDEPVDPLQNIAEYVGVARRLSLGERNVLSEWGGRFYNPTPAQVGNEPSAAA